jgi:lambda family phage portal protein
MIAPVKRVKLEKKHIARRKKRRSVGSWLSSNLDKAIYTLFPGWGHRRIQSRARYELLTEHKQIVSKRLEALRGKMFSGAENDRLRGDRWLSSRLSIDAGMETELKDLQERCSGLYKNNSVAHSAVEGRVTNEVGVGITAQSRVRVGDADQIKAELEDRLKIWSTYGVDNQRQMSIAQAEKLVCRSFASHGEAFVLFSNRSVDEQPGLVTMQLEIIAPERVETPPGKAGDDLVRMGVQYNRKKEVTGYWVRERHPGDRYANIKYTFYPRFEANGQPRMVHLFDPLFPAQSRGIPWLAASMNRLQDLEDFWEAELIAKQIEACFALVFTGSSEDDSPLAIAEGNSNETESTGKRLEEIQPGMIHYARDGESVNVVDPNRPGSSFAPFIEHTLRNIAGALNYPYELLAKNFFRTTFSSGQLAMLDGRMAFRMRRKVLIEQFLEPLYRRFVHENVFMDELGGLIDLLTYRDAPHEYERHIWQPQGWGFINPRDEVRANSQELEDDTTTLAAIYGEKGLDADDQLERRFEEKKVLLEQDVDLRKMQWDLETTAGIPHKEEQEEEKPSGVGDDAEDDLSHELAGLFND